METLRQYPGYCPIANICALTSEAAPPCGEDPDHLPPSITAESMCTNALAGRMQKEITEIAQGLWPADSARKHNTVAWYHFEQGMAAEDAVVAAKHFDRGLDYVDTAMHNPNSRVRDTLAAGMLHLYRPSFMTRKDKTSGTHELAFLRQGLGILYDALHAAPVHAGRTQHILDVIAEGQPHRPCVEDEGERNGLVVKLIGMMLAARQNILLHPASEREGRALGKFMTQNHDGYLLDGDQKVPVKIRMKGRSAASAGGTRSTSYDDSTVYVNMGGLINQALKHLRETQEGVYTSLLKTHLGRSPGVVDVGRILRNELGGQPQSAASVALIETIATRFEERLFEGRNTPKQPDVSVQREESATGTLAHWEVLPAEILSMQENSGRHDGQQKLRAAASANEIYLRYGNTTPDPEDLKQIISDMRQVKEPYLLVSCAAAYIDLARSSWSTYADATRLIEASVALTNNFAAKKWQEVPPDAAYLLYRCRLQRAYAEKYKRALAGEFPDLDDERRLYYNLLDVGRDSLEPAAILPLSRVRGVQFEIAIHLLNARLNLRNKRILRSMWPSLPREANPHDFNFKYRNGWDVATTTGGFLDQGLSCKYLQLQGIDANTIYNPSITLVRGKEDLGTKTTADIIIAARDELNPNSPELAARGKANLDTYEQLFLQRLGA